MSGRTFLKKTRDESGAISEALGVRIFHIVYREYFQFLDRVTLERDSHPRVIKKRIAGSDTYYADISRIQNPQRPGTFPLSCADFMFVGDDPKQLHRYSPDSLESFGAALAFRIFIDETDYNPANILIMSIDGRDVFMPCDFDCAFIKMQRRLGESFAADHRTVLTDMLSFFDTVHTPRACVEKAFEIFKTSVSDLGDLVCQDFFSVTEEQMAAIVRGFRIMSGIIANLDPHTICHFIDTIGLDRIQAQQCKLDIKKRATIMKRSGIEGDRPVVEEPRGLVGSLVFFARRLIYNERTTAEAHQPRAVVMWRGQAL